MITAGLEVVREGTTLTNKVFDKLGLLFEGYLRETGGKWEDNARFRREENLLRLKGKAEKIFEERGMTEPTRDMPMNFTVPLLGYASLEEDEGLQSLWARLLANAADASSGVELRTTYIDIVKSLSTFDVKLFDMIARLSHSDFPRDLPLGIETAEMPSNAAVQTSSQPGQPTEQVKLSLSNLEHLGCINPTVGFGGMPNFSIVYATPLGIGLYKACVK
jgi:hypothetical protein